jgi:hypothetical protein
LHAWLDEAVLPSYAAVAWLFHLHGGALGLLLYCGLQHFVVTRITHYPRGTWPLISFPAHARLDLLEGLLLLTGAILLAGDPVAARVLLGTFGVLQVGAFALSDTRWPQEERETTRPAQGG